MKRTKRPFSRSALAALTLVSHVTSLVPHAGAQSRASTSAHGEIGAGTAPAPPVTPATAVVEGPASPAPPPSTEAPAAHSAPSVATQQRRDRIGAPFAPGATPASLPTGADKTGVSSQVLALPQGAGKIQGMGESFSAQLSTGAASFSVPIALPAARGAAGPALALSYSTSGGHGLAGAGWDLGVPFIARQTDRGNPLYRDPAAGGAWAPTQDRFVFNGGQELVPICLVNGAVCAGAQPGEAMPAWANGWQYFRSRVEGSFLRVFWSPDHRTWRVHDKNGVSMEIGAPLAGDAEPGAVEVDPASPSHVYRWNLSRQYDAQGDANPQGSAPPLPVNVTRYRYTVDGGISYLTDIYDTPPRANAATASLATYAHHARLHYEARPDATISYRRGWAVTQGLRLSGIDVTSKPFSGTASARRLTRRYHVSYDATYHVSLLSAVQVEGRCGAAEAGEDGEPVVEDGNEGLPLSACPRLPAMTFGYTHVVPFRADGAVSSADLIGYEGFDERVVAMTGSPTHSLDEDQTDLFDIDANGLPDVLVTIPGAYGAGHGAFFNGAKGAGAFTAGTIGIQGVLGEGVSTLTLSNLNVSPGDLDGDGIVDLVHMPQVKSYSVYTPQLQNGAWSWVGRAVTTASQQSPKIDFGKDGLDVQRADVNGDGLVDVVVSTGTEMETFFALGKYPGGDGQFGNAEWTGPTTASIANDPVASCVPWDGVPIQLKSADVKIADMNGDGLPDIVRLHQGDVHYWPGRGDGTWGTGSPAACRAGTFGEGTAVAMASSPAYSDPNASGLRIDDVNGDGLDDFVQIRTDAVDIWLNVDGTSWTPRHVIANAPTAPAFQNRVRLADMNGSGTLDILWGDGGNYRFMDLSGGERPWILNHVENGLGKTTDLAYATAAALMTADAKAGAPWASVAPLAIHVVTQKTESDNLVVAGRPPGQYVTQYHYRDAVYDGRQREFRGFRTARETQLGDENSPTSSRETQFSLGECEDEEPPGALPSACTFAGRWRDNPREALKGQPLGVETFDEAGSYLSTVHATYRLRQLYVGLDGREVRHAYVSSDDAYAYDTSSTDHAATFETLPEIELETAPPPFSPSEFNAPAKTITVQRFRAVALHGTSGRAHVHATTDVDVFGNTYRTTSLGCDGANGCVNRDAFIRTYAQPMEIGNASGWLWRTAQSATYGEGDPYERDSQEHVYDSAGNERASYAYLQGSIPLVRSRANGGDVAPAPPSAAADGWITTSADTYDAFGNVVTRVMPNQHCRAVAFDDDYAQLLTGETIYAGVAGPNGCGGTPLTSIAQYDRGLGVPTRHQGIAGETTTTRFDGFGRVVAIAQPNPDTGEAGAVPSLTVEYLLPSDSRSTPFSRVHLRLQDGADPNAASYRDRWQYVDGLGRTVLALGQADRSAGDGGAWVADGLTTRDSKGAPQRAYLPTFFDGDPAAYPLATPAVGSFTRQRYDAFGRAIQSFALDGTLSVQSDYHALSVDAWDAADIQPGPHQGTYATSRRDGHDRVVSTLERVRVGPVLEQHETRMAYLSTGEAASVTRARLGSADIVTRWMRYDSLGRLVVNVEPDTTAGFDADPTTNISTLRSWRYAYDATGNVVGTSDARGCGSNYLYDAAGRLLGEDYSPCTTDHEPYSPVTSTSGLEVACTYDVVDSAARAGVIDGFDVDARWSVGRPTSITDRAGKVLTRYDARGRGTGVARRLVGPTGALAARWYVQLNTYDPSDRALVERTGVVEAGAPLDITSRVTTAYSKRGGVKSVDSDHGALVDHVVHDADGLLLEVGYADAAKTTTATTYDIKRRLRNVQTYRGPPALWSSPPASYAPAPPFGESPSTLQLLLEDADYTYDAVDNPIEIHDWRLANEWPAGAKPVTRAMQYDDLYRLTRIDHQYGGGADAWTSPFDAENQHESPDPRRATPAPHVAFDRRVSWQTFAYDWLGNTSATNDDARGFFDRSLGTITNGTATSGPYQLRLASNASSTPGTPSREGSLGAAYDDAGNLTSITLLREGPCLPSGRACSQRFAYGWDEVGRLARARRWDLAAPDAASARLPESAPDADLRYVYDAIDERAIKAVTLADGTTRSTVYALQALELRGAPWDEAAGDYVRSHGTQVPYLFAHGVRLGRVAYAEDDYPSLTSGAVHLLLEIPDHLGSSAIVLDRDTGELVERSTYQAYGAVESDYRPERWKAFREDYRFTGKEDDVEVGLAYFGKRFYSPALGRWISADPLSVHGLGADANAYAYVHGTVFRAVDPTGLQDHRQQTDTDNRQAAQLAPNDPQRQEEIKAEWNHGRWEVTKRVYSGLACAAFATPCLIVTLGTDPSHAGENLAEFFFFGKAAEIIGGRIFRGEASPTVSSSDGTAPVTAPALEAPASQPAPASPVAEAAPPQAPVAEPPPAAPTAPPLKAAFVPKHPVNIPTKKVTTQAELDAIHEYARRANAWYEKVGPKVITSTKTPGRGGADKVAGAERVRAEKAGTPYKGVVGHVPDTAAAGGDPTSPAGFLDMPGKSNAIVGGVLGRRVGQTIDHYTIGGNPPLPQPPASK